MPKDDINLTDWTAVSARAQAYLAMYQAGLSEKSVTERAKFLMNLGLSRSDAAVLLGSTDDSVRHLLASASKKEATAAAKPVATATKAEGS